MTKSKKTLVDNWDLCYDLYLSQDDIVKLEEQEEATEFNKGCKTIVKNYLIELSKPIFETKGKDIKLFKTFADIPTQSNHTARELGNLYNSFFRDDERMKKAEEAHNEAIKKGFKYFAFIASKPKQTNIFIASCGVCRYEKTDEYKRTEKLAKEISKFLYKGEHITTAQMSEILKHYNITKKRIKKG